MLASFLAREDLFQTRTYFPTPSVYKNHGETRTSESEGIKALYTSIT